MTISLRPMHGRDYTSKAAVLADWDANKDFIITDLWHGAHGKPTSKADCRQMGEASAMIRYSKLTKQCEAKT
jgi:hypothetical protein